MSGKGGGLSGKTGYQGSTTLISLASGLGQPQAVMACNFDSPDVYTCLFSITEANVLPIPTPSPIWPPPFSGPNGNEPLPPPALIASQPVSGIFGIRTIAIVTWTVEGAQFNRRLDIGSGALISACAQGCSVQVYDASSTVNAAGANAGQQYGVSCAITRGVRPTNQVPTLWAAAGQLNIGANVTIPVPVDSGVNAVEVTAFVSITPAVPPALQVEHIIGASVNKGYVVTQGDLGFIRIAPGTTSIALINESGAITSYYVQFGIDG
jgi:hypothetical protein